MFYELAGRQYPKLILGSDRFLNIFPKPRPAYMLEESFILEVMEAAWNNGCGGFDLNTMSPNILNAYARLRDRCGGRVVGIGDPNWRSGYMLAGTHLMDIKSRVIRTIFENQLNPVDRALIAALPEKNRKFWFSFDPDAITLSQEEIAAIHINEDVWLPRLRTLSTLASYCLVGADYADWMILLDRKDLLQWQIETIVAHGMIPISVSHWTSISLPSLDLLPVYGHWLTANLETMYLSTPAAVAAIGRVAKPVTCFRILRGIDVPGDIPRLITWLRREIKANSLVIGADNKEQAQETFSMARKAMDLVPHE